MIERYWGIERTLRDALKKTTEPLVDTYLREALFWLEKVKEDDANANPAPQPEGHGAG